MNIAAAGVAGAIVVEHADALTGEAPASAGMIVTNPPYGVRLAGSRALAEMYPRLGDALKQRFAGWSAYLLSGDTRLPKLIGLRRAGALRYSTVRSNAACTNIVSLPARCGHLVPAPRTMPSAMEKAVNDRIRRP